MAGVEVSMETALKEPERYTRAATDAIHRMNQGIRRRNADSAGLAKRGGTLFDAALKSIRKDFVIVVEKQKKRILGLKLAVEDRFKRLFRSPRVHIEKVEKVFKLAESRERFAKLYKEVPKALERTRGAVHQALHDLRKGRDVAGRGKSDGLVPGARVVPGAGNKSIKAPTVPKGRII